MPIVYLDDVDEHGKARRRYNRVYRAYRMTQLNINLFS